MKDSAGVHRLRAVGLAIGSLILGGGCEPLPGAGARVAVIERPRVGRAPIVIEASARAFLGSRSPTDVSEGEERRWKLVCMVDAEGSADDPTGSDLSARAATQAATLVGLAYLAREVSGSPEPATLKLDEQIELTIQWAQGGEQPEAVELLLDDRGRITKLSEKNGRLTHPPLSSKRFGGLMRQLAPRIKRLPIDRLRGQRRCIVRLGLYQQ